MLSNYISLSKESSVEKPPSSIATAASSHISWSSVICCVSWDYDSLDPESIDCQCPKLYFLNIIESIFSRSTSVHWNRCSLKPHVLIMDDLLGFLSWWPYRFRVDHCKSGNALNDLWIYSHLQQLQKLCIHFAWCNTRIGLWSWSMRKKCGKLA